MDEEINALFDLPNKNNSAMDGFAVRHDDLEINKSLRVVGRVGAESVTDYIIKKDEAMRIMTGSGIPKGADSVVPFENTNINTITPTGWVHEQNNNKVTMDSEVVAKEIGIARYQRINDFDWSAGYSYWDETSNFWNKVREVWDEKIKSKKIKVTSNVNGESLFLRLFLLANNYREGDFESIENIELIIEQHSSIE